jgi:Protein of unknown function (DUF1579)
MAKNEATGQNRPARGVAAGVVDQAPKPGPEHKRMEVFIGKWINEGHTIASAGAPSLKIPTSDVYEWMPGGFFVLHTAYGRIGDMDVGGTEIIGYDAASGTYRSHFFDSQGNTTTDELTVDGDTWTWRGAQTRTTAVFGDNGKTQTAHHERSDDGVNWVPSMEVTLTKVE